MKTCLENFEVRKHYKGSVTTKENRGQRLTRKVSGIRKSVTNKLHQKMDIYESVFEEGRRRSIKRKDTGFSRRTLNLMLKRSVPGIYLTCRNTSISLNRTQKMRRNLIGQVKRIMLVLNHWWLNSPDKTCIRI